MYYSEYNSCDLSGKHLLGNKYHTNRIVNESHYFYRDPYAFRNPKFEIKSARRTEECCIDYMVVESTCLSTPICQINCFDLLRKKQVHAAELARYLSNFALS